MSSSGDTVVDKMNVCRKCGDKGDVKRLIYCNKCHASAEHSYCLDTLPRKGEKEVLWACEECCSIDANPTPVSSRKSERIEGAANIKLNRMKLRKRTRFSPVTEKAYTDSSSQVKQPVSDYCSMKEAIETQSTSQCLQNEELKKPRRRFVVKDDSSSDEESDIIECLVVNPLQSAPAVAADSLNVSHSSPPSESDRYIHAKPIIDPIWKGSFNIQNLENHTSVLLLAHLSTNACSKVWDAASALPAQLNMEILSRSDAWPHKFQITPPAVESIGLYFFPQRERDEKVFESLLDEMIIHDRALKAVINDLELLVFSSCELPQEHWRFCQKYYLWGVFKATKKHAVASNAEASMPSNLSNNAGPQDGESVG
ncbi:PHD finger-containing protein 1 isoform X1 [Populus alba]|uniref:PHD finger-containing protein 1 isoform X1 n=1 Tax=Populus alba TaxID=43335 RepID=UPI003CC730CA